MFAGGNVNRAAASGFGSLDRAAEGIGRGDGDVVAGAVVDDIEDRRTGVRRQEEEAREDKKP